MYASVLSNGLLILLWLKSSTLLVFSCWISVLITNDFWLFWDSAADIKRCGVCCRCWAGCNFNGARILGPYQGWLPSLPYLTSYWFSWSAEKSLIWVQFKSFLPSCFGDCTKELLSSLLGPTEVFTFFFVIFIGFDELFCLIISTYPG